MASSELLQWLKKHGVEDQQARQFLVESGCKSVASLALYLRLQLTFPFSNEDTINTGVSYVLNFVVRYAAS
jgi:hypothetical protein